MLTPHAKKTIAAAIKSAKSLPRAMIALRRAKLPADVLDFLEFIAEAETAVARERGSQPTVKKNKLPEHIIAEVDRLLHEGELSYGEIAKRTGMKKPSVGYRAKRMKEGHAPVLTLMDKFLALHGDEIPDAPSDDVSDAQK